MIKQIAENVGDLVLYKMMSDETKLNILKYLRSGEKCVGEITTETGLSQPLVSHKLKDLRETGLVISYRSGKNIIYALSDPFIETLLDTGERAGNSLEKICNCVECDEKD